MELYTRSIHSLALQVSHYFGIPLTIPQHSTLNEKFGIQASATLGTTELPRVRYLALGIGGHDSTPGLNGLTLMKFKIHQSRDAGMFMQIPLVLRPVGNDLTDAEKANYALRKIENYNGNDYFAYYLKRLKTEDMVVKLQNRDVDVNQNTTLSPFIPTSDDLSPTPIDLSNTGTNTVTGKYLSATVNLSINLQAFDAEELLNSINIIYGNENYAIISEFALVSGVDRSVSSSDGAGGTITFNEAVCTQIANHVPALQPVFSQRNGFELTIEVGGIEPLLNLELANP